MPRYELPKGWPNPYDLLRDVDYEQNYPRVLLRGIWNVIDRGDVGGNLEFRFKAGFNFAVTAMVRGKPPRLFLAMVRKGIATKDALTTKGIEREGEVVGLRDLSKTSKRRYGGKSRSEMEADTKRKLKQLAQWVNIIRSTTREPGMPNVRVIEQGGDVNG